MRLNNVLFWCIPFFFFLGFYLLSFELQRTDTIPLIVTYSSLFVLIWFWIRNYSNLTSIFFIGITCRLIFWNHIPELSQDFYRFIWDGNIQLLGIDPYRYTPSEIIDLIVFPNAELLYEKMGDLSNGHYSNYPPLSQYIYQVMAYFNREAIIYPVLALRVLYFIGELVLFFVSILLFKHLKIPSIYISWYFLNPLVIVEGFGNLHGETLMTLFTVLSWLFCIKRKPILGGFFMSLAIGAKLLPLLLIPFFFQYLRLQKIIVFGLSILTFSIFLWFPFFNSEMIENYTKTIQLWFTTFEFNGSIYKIIRAIGYEIKGYNIIRKLGQITPFINTFFIVIFSIFNSNHKPQNIFKNMLLFLSCYFFISTTVHPWYIINIIFLGILTGYAFPILWSMTVFWSYSSYGVNIVEEKIGWQLSAYLLVYICFFYEITIGRLGNHIHKSNFFRI